MPESGKLRKSATQRQKEYIDRQRERGYVLLTACWVPASQREAIREKVKVWVEEFEKSCEQL